MRPRLFDPFFRKSHELYSSITSEDRQRALKITFMICGFFVIKCILVFFYVENFVEIPSEWKDHLRSICPHMKKVDFLHN